MRPKGATKRICVRGHDTSVCGRHRNHACRECKREDNRKRVRRGGTSRVCVNGHDTLACGRYANGVCRRCQQLYNRNSRRPPGKVSTRPLRQIARTQAWAGQQYRAHRMTQKRVSEMAAQKLFTSHWVGIDTADIWCAVLGTDLSVVYPELYTGRVSA